MVDSDQPERPAKISQSDSSGLSNSQSESAEVILQLSNLEINDKNKSAEVESWVGK